MNERGPSDATRFDWQPGALLGPIVESTAINATSTANAGAFAWKNKNGRSVLAHVIVRFLTAGTGTMDVGVSSDGTGSSDGIIDGGTLTGVVASQRSAGATAGNTSWFLVNKAGTGTNNSIVAVMSDTATSTAIGTAYVVYFLV
ncbi:MAG: hypothetical protein Q8O40_16310 [Chloroflexota bacterium]|nr:hypothetical protein [Chloroflexota bacterium]